MAIQHEEKKKDESKAYDITILISFLVLSCAFGLSAAIILGVVVKSLLMASLISLISTCTVSFTVLHIVFSNEMSQFDSRMLHELSKRKLIEIVATEEDL